MTETNDCLTATFKLKRNFVKKQFQDIIDLLYEEVAAMEAQRV